LSDDPVVEGNETFSVAITNPTGGAPLGTPSSQVVTIVDNDVPPPPTGGKPFAVGTDAGAVATVTLYNGDGTVRFTARPFGDQFTGGVRVATGDVTGDGFADVVVSNVDGSVKTVVKVIDGKTGTVLPKTLSAGDYYYGQASLALGDITGDGIDDIAVGSDEAGPKVRIYRGGDFALIASA